MTEDRQKELENFANSLEHLSQEWRPEHSLFRAARELRFLARGRDSVPSEDGFLESAAAEREPLPSTRNPYFNHLPNVSWQMLVKFSRV